MYYGCVGVECLNAGPFDGKNGSLKIVSISSRNRVGSTSYSDGEDAVAGIMISSSSIFVRLRSTMLFCTKLFRRGEIWCNIAEKVRGNYLRFAM